MLLRPPPRQIEEYFGELRAVFRRHGWTVQYVESDRTPYAYTMDSTTGTCPNS